jgi:plasmid stabilization system protein ParE
MLVLERHPLVSADLLDAYNWYEDQQPGLGLEFARDFLSHYRHLARGPELYAVRFDSVRRLNLDPFPYGIFYVFRNPNIWILGVLHASRDTQTVIAERRRHFRG